MPVSKLDASREIVVQSCGKCKRVLMFAAVFDKQSKIFQGWIGYCLNCGNEVWVDREP